MSDLQAMHSYHSSVFSRELYMTLPSVKDAYAKVEGTEAFSELLRQFGGLLTTVGAEDLGVFLLHRHFAVGPAAIPLERKFPWTESGEYALITSPTTDWRDEKLAPSRWRFNVESQVFEALEYSTDPLVLEGWARLSSNPEVAVAAGRILEDSGLWPFLGLTIASRSSLPRKPGEIYMETSDPTTLASIVRVEQKDTVKSAKQTPTVWIPVTSCWCTDTGMECAINCYDTGSDERHDLIEHCYVPSEQHHTVPCV